MTWASEGLSAFVRRERSAGRLEPDRLLVASPLDLPRVRLPASELLGELFETDPCVADERQRVVLGGVVRSDVERDNLEVAGLEQRPGAGGEVLETRPDCEHDIGVAGQRVGRRRAADADGADGERMGFVD